MADQDPQSRRSAIVTVASIGSMVAATGLTLSVAEPLAHEGV